MKILAKADNMDDPNPVFQHPEPLTQPLPPRNPCSPNQSSPVLSYNTMTIFKFRLAPVVRTGRNKARKHTFTALGKERDKKAPKQCGAALSKTSETSRLQLIVMSKMIVQGKYVLSRSIEAKPTSLGSNTPTRMRSLPISCASCFYPGTCSSSVHRPLACCIRTLGEGPLTSLTRPSSS